MKPPSSPRVQFFILRVKKSQLNRASFANLDQEEIWVRGSCNGGVWFVQIKEGHRVLFSASRHRYSRRTTPVLYPRWLFVRSSVQGKVITTKRVVLWEPSRGRGALINDQSSWIQNRLEGSSFCWPGRKLPMPVVAQLPYCIQDDWSFRVPPREICNGNKKIGRHEKITGPSDTSFKSIWYTRPLVCVLSRICKK